MAFNALAPPLTRRAKLRRIYRKNHRASAYGTSHIDTLLLLLAGEDREVAVRFALATTHHCHIAQKDDPIPEIGPGSCMLRFPVRQQAASLGIASEIYPIEASFQRKTYSGTKLLCAQNRNTSKLQLQRPGTKKKYRSSILSVSREGTTQLPFSFFLRSRAWCCWQFAI